MTQPSVPPTAIEAQRSDATATLTGADRARSDAGPRREVASPGPVTLRAVLIALLLIPPNAWWLIQIEYVRYSDNATTSSLFFNAITLLLLLLLANAGLRRV